MCGIAGYSVSTEHSGPAALSGSQSLRDASDALSHRGPDDAGVYEDLTAGIGLAHRRLSIVDLSPLGHQPMLSPDGRVVLVYNGEIYNFLELRRDLEARGVTFRSTSDTEVLLQLYLTEGRKPAAMLRRLNGIFTLAIWDEPAGELLVARDALGVKPLYIAELPGCFAFASEIKALLHLLPPPPLTDALDLEALYRYGSFQWCPGAGTPLKIVRKLLPGELVIVRRGRVEQRQTWYTLPIQRWPDVHRYNGATSEASMVEGTLQHLRAAVHRQMVADVPVGAFLSGGLDSSAVVVLARERNPDIRCFTIESPGGVDAGTVDDLPYARRVAAHLNVPLDVVRVDSAQMAAGLEAMVAQLDEPLADPAPLNVLFISQLAREHGIKVLLSGAGGDDLFTGYRRHRALDSERYWRWLPKPARTALQEVAGSLDQRNGAFRRITKLFGGAALDGDERIAHYFSWADRDDLLSLYTPAVRAAVAASRREAPFLDFLGALPAGVTPLERMLALEQRFFLSDHNLLYTDKMSMAVGVEVRVPFLDLDLVEFAARLPARVKQRGAIGKWVLKQAMQAYLPHDVIYRPKTGFGAPLRRWMRVELRELLGDVLSETSLRKRGLFDAAGVQRLIRANDAGTVDASYTLLSVLCIELWCRRYLSAC